MRVEWITLGLIALAYTAWGLLGWLLYPHLPALALGGMGLVAAFHASLVHECLHGHPTRRRWLNELLVTANLSLIWPYRRFRTLHLRHHNDAHLTDPFEDPESYYRALWKFRALPSWVRALLRVNNTMIGRMIFGPILGTIGLVVGDARAIMAGERKIMSDWVLHLLSILPVLWAVDTAFGIPLWLYVVTVVWGSMSLISIRTFAEHRWSDSVDGRTIIVERSPLSLLFLNNNLHIVHHKHPAAPWYELPALYNRDRAYWRQLNEGYVFLNYSELFRRWGWRQKEWVDHPELHRDRLIDDQRRRPV